MRGKEEEAERSDLTKEHEQPVSSLNFCHSPDSSAIREKPITRGSIVKAHGNTLRIRVPLQRKKEPEEPLRSEQSRSGSRGPESLVQQRETSITPCQSDCQPSTSQTEVGFSSDKDNNAGIDSVTLHKRKRHKVESLYQSLIVDWIPPPHPTS